MAVEMEIRLIDGTPQEQAAFDQPRQQFSQPAPVEVANRTVDNPSAAVPEASASSNEAKPTAAFPSVEGPGNNEVIKTVQGLSSRIGELIGALHSSMNEPDTKSSGAAASDSSSTTSATVNPVESISISANQVNVHASKTDNQSDGSGSDSSQQPSAPKQPSQQTGMFGEIRKSIVNRIQSTRVGKAASRVIQMGRQALRSSGIAPRVRAAATRVTNRIAKSSFGRAIAGLGTRAATASAPAVVSGGTAAGLGAAGTAVASVAAPVAIAVGAIGSLAVAAKLGGDALLGMAGDLSELSGPLAAAKAQGQMNTELNMIDRAQKLGPGLGQIANANNRLNDATEKLLTQMLQILTRAAPAIEAGADTLTAIVAAADVGLKSLDALLAASTFWNDKDDGPANEKLSAALNNLGERFGDIFKNNDNDEDLLERDFENFLKLNAAKRQEEN